MALDPVATGDPHAAAHNAERAAINSLEEQVGQRMVFPVLPKTGQQLRYNGNNWVGSETRLFEGTGQPEGVVAAPIGSRYVDIAGTNGAVEYLKGSGTNPNDNTGWILLKADTGWRNISSMIDKRGSGVVNHAYLRRCDQLVELYLDLKMPTNTASPYTLFTLPIGFRPDFDRFGGLQDNNEAAAAFTKVNKTGEVLLYNIVSAKNDRWNGNWLTATPWPSSLPGIALP